MGKKESYVSAKVGSLIGGDLVLYGDFTAIDSVRVEGEIRGSITAESILVIGPTGKVTGSINGGDIVVGGVVEGDIISNGRIEVAGTGNIGGNITAKSLIIDENATFTGQCTMYREEGSEDTLPQEDSEKEEEVS